MRQLRSLGLSIPPSAPVTRKMARRLGSGQTGTNRSEQDGTQVSYAVVASPAGNPGSAG